MTPKAFAAFVGAVALIIGIVFLALPHSVASDTIQCGSGFTGLKDDAGLAEFKDRLTAAMLHEPRPSLTYVDDCKSAVNTAQIVGWPLLALGGIVTLRAIVI